MADSWKQWSDMAEDSARAARLLQDNEHHKSCLSRYYYAAYQASTAILLYLGLTPPATEGREAWSHEITPELIRDHFNTLVHSRDKRNDLASRLERLRNLRLDADYHIAPISDAVMQGAAKDAGYLLKFVQDALP